MSRKTYINCSVSYRDQSCTVMELFCLYRTVPNCCTGLFVQFVPEFGVVDLWFVDIESLTATIQLLKYGQNTDQKHARI